MKKITIITPTYNRAKTLPKVFESLLKQSFKDFIWIILDDGSTDNTTEVVENFQLFNPFFEIHNARFRRNNFTYSINYIVGQKLR